MIVSWLTISKLVISGSQITTLLVLVLAYLASKSPNVLVVDNLPGNTLKGPTIISYFPSIYVIAVV